MRKKVKVKRKFTDAHRLKLALARKGRKHPRQVKEKIALTMRGHKVKEETITKMYARAKERMKLFSLLQKHLNVVHKDNMPKDFVCDQRKRYTACSLCGTKLE